jgi:hypothetical protein
MKDVKIENVNSNLEKRYTYAQQKGRLKRALKSGFCFEALLIEYALMEDRMMSFLYHAGVVNTRESNKVDCRKDNKQALRKIYCSYIRKEPEQLPGIRKISGKREMIEAIFAWSTTASDSSIDSDYLMALKKQCESVDIGAMLDTLKELEDWCKYRNEVVHGLMNKNIDSLNAELQDRAEEGLAIVNALDSYAKEIKKCNKVRKAAGLKIEK